MKYNLLYMTTNLVNGRRYVGVHSTEDIDDGYFGSGKALKNAVKKYGEENFLFDVLRYCNDEAEMLEHEARIVDECFISRKDNYNIVVGGGMPPRIDQRGRVFTEEHRRNISISGKGRPCSQETRKKLSERSTGRLHSEEAKAKMSESRKGMKFSESHRESISNVLMTRPEVECPYCGKAGKGGLMKHWHFDNCKENPNGTYPSSHMKGKKQTEEVKKKISESLTGRTLSYETRIKLSKKAKQQWHNKEVL